MASPTTTILAQQAYGRSTQISGSVDMTDGPGGVGVVGTNPDGTRFFKDDVDGNPYAYALFSFPITDADALDPSKNCIIYLSWSWDGQSYRGGQRDGARDPAYGWSAPFRDKHGNPQGPFTAPSIPLDPNPTLPDGSPNPTYEQPPVRCMLLIDITCNGLNIGGTVAFKSIGG